ncbi:TonB-dependent receptor [Pseudoalteromonas sp. L23]|uniref:TonB-dependent receptor n=1 Tax=unclassified Pseudoalteromonas TaxID=194690 RepID=UPI001EF15A94|nr:MULTISPECIES: TonB-dependent receptor [unclassified Pseudoalteromonas]MCF7512190.1 TonB-dependent receptor [Pseudoalteromonas sp. L7]MCF7524596.1 TonB-dependent receptor [Pseudoalteromonas sp. L23]MCX2766635.1 TonB-dependent receptor [Pseudoalteromonas sp. B530]
MPFLSQKSHFFRKTTIASAVSLACFSLSFGVLAEQSDTENELKKVERITVVGATTNSEITPAVLANYQANDLEDIFRHTPSVTVGGSLGIAQKIFVRGVEDSMVNVTVDGAPQTSTLFHHIGRVAIEPELLKSVEVQAGAGEATAGSGAVGGAIRFKTKSAADLLDENERFGGTAKVSYFTNDGHKESLSLYGKATDSIGILASYVTVSRKNTEDGDGNTLPGTAADQTLGFIKLNAKLTEFQDITVSYEQRKEDGEFGKQTNWAPLESDPLFASWGERETLVLNHNWFLNSLVNLETTVYQTKSSFKRELYTWDASIETIGFDIRNTSDIGTHSITYGIEHKNDKVHSQSYEDFGGIFDEDGTVLGAYVQDHWQVFPDLRLSFGLRFDSYELDHQGIEANWVKVDGVWVVETDAAGAPVTSTSEFSAKKQDGFSKNVGLLYNLADNLTLSLGYAEALRGRQIADAFTVGELTPNANLVPEEVENVELGIQYNDGAWMFEASVYSSTINGVVFDKFKGREGVFYENIGDLGSEGFELVGGYQADNFDVIVSFNHNNVELDNVIFNWPDPTDATSTNRIEVDNIDLAAYEYGGLGNAVGDSLNVDFNYHLNDQIKLGWNYKYVASLNNIEVFHRSIELGWVEKLETIDKPSYQLVDAYVSYEPFDSLRVDLSIQNLLDESYRSHGSVADYGHIPGYEGVVGIKEAGRDIRLTVAYQF